MFYSVNPTGKVFTNAPNSAAEKQAFVDYWTNGGSWAGQHSASDFENSNSWSWFQDNIDGAWFVSHNPPGTNGTITWQPEFINHPIVKGLPSPYNSGEEWYVMNRDVSQVKGFQVLGKVAVSSGAPRPAVWITENANGKGGRAFYTIKGHQPSTYAEAPFRQLMLRGILWSVPGAHVLLENNSAGTQES